LIEGGDLGLELYWEDSLAQSVPEAANLKTIFPERWVRFHSMPKAKRYPETDKELTDVIKRYNSIIESVSNIPCKLYVMLSVYSEEFTLPCEDEKHFPDFETIEHWKTVSQYKGTVDEYFIHISVAYIEYMGVELNELFRLVSDDQLGNVMIVDVVSSTLYHPYDGGIDVILSSEQSRDAVAQTHSDWCD